MIYLFTDTRINKYAINKMHMEKSKNIGWVGVKNEIGESNRKSTLNRL